LLQELQIMSLLKSFVVAAVLLAAPAVSMAGEHQDEAKAHDATAYDVGSKVEDFSLTRASDGETVSLSSLAGEKGVVLVFYNQECPYVKEAQPRISEFHDSFKDKGLPVVAVDAGTNNSAEAVKGHGEQVPFTLLLNPESTVASRFGATRTPEVFLIDSDMTVRYHGAFDNGKLQGENATRQPYVIEAANALLAGEPLQLKQTKAFGCTLKYAKGVEALPRQAASTAEEGASTSG